ncbi:PAS domain S-box protein [uncultured Thiodictyon sp.]|uniref:PAS domain S-box protein n=1 Tax=uncultured Thiodictyon sp. TaxID=1846217 RepID=UPI0025D1F67C|nr:PAS domain S-box protein [uncultured Thiodictyon sp.]
MDTTPSAAPPPTPPAAGPTLARTLSATAALALLALAGNHFNLSLLFGVDLLFGSVAVLLALVWLGTWPGLLVALIGGSYTWLLWDHPYALIILVAEAAAVAWHRRHAQRRGCDAPPLAVSVSLYWFLIGIPLVLLCYRVGLGMGWSQTLLVAPKQALNGILNAGLADLVVLAAAARSGRRGALPGAQVLFSVLLSGLLLPTLLLTVWQNQDIKDHLEREQAARLNLFALTAAHYLGPQHYPHGLSAAELDTELADLKGYLTAALPAGSDSRVQLVPNPDPPSPTVADPQHGSPSATTIIGQPPPQRTGIPTGTEGLQLILPGGELPSRMARWRLAHYRMQIPVTLASGRTHLVVEFSAAPLIDDLQQTVTRRFLALLVLAGLGITLAQGLSRWLVRPLQRLVTVTRALPAAIGEARPWPAPRPGLLAETGQLTDAVQEMAQSLAASFQSLQAEQAQQAHQRSLVERQAEALAQSESLLLESQAIAHLGSWELDLATGALVWSYETFRVLGYVPGALTPTLDAYFAVIPADDHASIHAALERARGRPGLTQTVEHRAQGPDGVPRTLLTTGRTILNAAGQALRLTGSIQDITDRKAVELALADQRQRLANIIAATRAGTWEWEVQTGATVVNERWAEIVGYDLAELAPISIQTLTDLTHPADLQRCMDLAQAHFRGELADYECELRMRHKDGHWVWVLDQGRVMEWDAPGVPRLMSGIHQDITERKQAELAVAGQESMVSELLALATEFVGVPDLEIAALTARALERVGRFAHVDRSYIVRFDTSANTLTNTMEWTAAGIAPALALNQAIPCAELPALMERLPLGEPIVVPRVAELQPDWSREREICNAQGIASILIAPLIVGERLLGTIGFDAVHTPRDWSAMEVRFLQVLASILAGAVDRAQTTEDLRASNARYEQLAHQSRSMSWEIDPEGRYTYVSPVCEQVLGYRPEELIGGHFYDHLAGPDREQVKAAIFAIMECREPLRDFDRLCLGIDHWRVWLTTSGAPLLAADGTYLGYRGIDTDITDRHLAQELIRESEARLNAVFENAPIGMALIAADRRFTLVNRTLATFLGRSQEELTGSRFDEVTHPDDLGHNLDLFAELQAGRRADYRIKKHYLRPDGAMVWGDVRVTLLPSRPGAPPTPLAMIEDITDLQAATQRQHALEEALSRHAAQLEQLVDLINQALPPAQKDRALLGLGCRSLGVAAAVLGLVTPQREHQVLIAVTDPDLGPNLGTDLDAGPDEPRPAQLAAVLTQTLAHRDHPCVLTAEQLPGARVSAGFRSCVGLAFDGPRLSGQTETLLLSLWGLEPVLELGDPERQMLRLIAQRLAAVRYQEQIQHDLVKSRERETIGHLASGVAHDFNNLLGIIDANLYFLGTTLPGADSDPEICQVLEETHSALGQAKVITSGMLSLSRAGGVPLGPIDLAETIDELARILRQVLPPAIRLTVAIPPGLRVWSNAGFLQAALLNLALNARDAMPQGGELHIETADRHWTGQPPLAVGALTPMDCVELRVCDTGSGITPAIIERIFDPLFSTKAKQRGHGLGLFMVREFIARSAAGLEVESRLGHGSCFRLLLPPVSADSATPRPDPQSVPPGGDTDALPPGLRVLLVDDDPRVREAVARLLTLEGVVLAQAEHGQAALARLAQDGGFDLVLSDIAMPGLDGIGLYRHLARERPGLPVILMTGQDSTLAVTDDLPEHPLVLRKPLDPAALRAAIRTRVVHPQ